METARRVDGDERVIQHHVMLEMAEGDWVLLRSLDEDCLEQAEAFASEYAAVNYCSAIVATTAVEFTGRLTPKDILKGFAEGEKFVDRNGRRVIAVDPDPAIIEGEDSVNVQFEGVDYGGDFWDSFDANDLRRNIWTVERGEQVDKVISDERMDQLIRRAKDAASRTTGGGDGSPLREHFSDDAYKTTLDALIEVEVKRGADGSRMTIARRRLSEHLTVYKDGEHLVFENSRGMMVNGNRRIHMANWTLNDLRDVICHLTGKPDCCCHITKTDGPEEHEAECRYA